MNAISKTSVLFATIGFLFVGCSNSSSEVDLLAETAIIRELIEIGSTAEGRKDVEAVLDLYWNDSVLLPAGRDALNGKEAIRSGYKRLFQLPITAVTSDSTLVKVSKSGDLAYSWGNFTVELVGPNGPETSSSKYLSVWEKREGEWKVIANMVNSNSPSSQ